MFFRFLCAVALIVLISLAGVGLEKESLETRRKISKQHYQMEILRESFAKMRLRVQELGAPEKLIESVEEGKILVRPPEKSQTTQTERIPLLHWETDRHQKPPASR